MSITVIIPYLLVSFRLALAPLFWLGYLLHAPGWLYLALLVGGAVSDYYDGALARQWGTTTRTLRRFDSNTDTLFWGSAGLVAILLHGDAVRPWLPGIMVMFGAMILQNLVSGWRYLQQPAYHMYSGKLWSAALGFALAALFLGSRADWMIDAVIALGIVNSVEGMIASLILPRPMTDIPTVFHAVALARSEKRVGPAS